MTFERDILAPQFPSSDVSADVAPPVTRRTLTLTISLLVTAVLAAVLLVMPTPYAVRAPGPTENTLGSQELGEGSSMREVPLVDVPDDALHEATGELLLTTVSVFGGPGGDVLVGDVLLGWAARDRSVQPVELVFPVGITREQQQEESQAEMLSSQESATVAALTELGYDVPATLTIAGTSEGTGAEGVAQVGDVVRSLDGEPIETYPELLEALAQVTPGDEVMLGVDRDGEAVDLTITTSEGDGRALVGVLIDPQYDLPVDVRIQIENIGGPSAGMMFALAIINKLTPEDELDGQVVAGTGTIDVDGRVGPIGGIEQKMFGAVRDGADWFLAPTANCDQVVGNVPDGLTVVAVSTLADARQATEAIGAGDAHGLPTCS